MPASAKRKTKARFVLLGIGLGVLAYRRRWNILHNGLVHPLFVIAEDAEWLNALHDWTGEKWTSKK